MARMKGSRPAEHPSRICLGTRLSPALANKGTVLVSINICSLTA